MKYKLIGLFFILQTLILFACRNQTSPLASETDISKKNQNVQDTIQSICIWNGTPVRKTPDRKAKWLTSLNTGEVVLYYGERKIDSADNNRPYLYVQLSDGLKGWAPAYGIIQNAAVAVVKAETPIYKRPDLLTITDVILTPMNIVAISKTQNEWYEIITEKREHGGWIHKEKVSFNPEDIALAALANKSIDYSKPEKAYVSIQNFLKNNPYPTSLFVNYLKGMASKSKQDMEEDDAENKNQDYHNNH
jgi:hypothetical protein